MELVVGRFRNPDRKIEVGRRASAFLILVVGRRLDTGKVDAVPFLYSIRG